MSSYELDTNLKQLITAEQAFHYRIIPVSKTDGEITFLCDEKVNIKTTQEELFLFFGFKTTLITKASAEIEELLFRNYRVSQSNQKESLLANQDFIAKILRESLEYKSSDIHIEPYEEVARVRYRVDGKLIEKYTISLNEYPSLVNKVKIKARLDIAEKRLPQDGRIKYQDELHEFDIRVSILPTIYGEKIVLRLLKKEVSTINLQTLGFSEQQLAQYRRGVQKTNGIILISGPTGSGKTTTLYATLHELNKTYANILTVEDPVEYTLTGVNQVQLKESIGLTFASTLKSFLRQDPDIIMVGEIRDVETAQMAIRAALTGHLVLSTIHTNSALGTIDRLIDMGIPAYLVANTLNLSIAQRLVRLLCEHCKEETPFKQEELPTKKQFKKKKTSTVFKEKGCNQCFHTGYSGRKAIYEIIPINEQLAKKIKSQEISIEEQGDNSEYINLQEAAVNLFLEGQTSLKEIYPILIKN